MKAPGKKVGALVVRLERKRTRYKNAEISVELRLDIQSGDFHACYEGNWYRAATKAEIADMIRAAAKKTVDLEWQRYIVIDYSATANYHESIAAGRLRISGAYTTLGIKDSRAELAGKRHVSDPDDPRDSARGEWDEAPMVITGLELRWQLVEFSEPYPLPEDPGKLVRSSRTVDVVEYGPSTGEECLGAPEEQDDDDLPSGAVQWTAEREAFLCEVLSKFGEIDAKLVELFRGEPAQVGARLDERAFFGLLPAGGDRG